MDQTVRIADIERLLTAAIPAGMDRAIDRQPDSLLIDLPQQPGVPWPLAISFDGVPGGGEHILGIFSELLKFEIMTIDAVDRRTLGEFVDLVEDLLAGRLEVEVARFRSTGKHWRTRLIDPRKPAGDEVLTRYYRRAFRLWRAVDFERVRFGA